MKRIENMFKNAYIMFTYGDNYVGNKQVATVRMLYTFAFYFAKRYTGSSMLMRVTVIARPSILLEC